MRKDTKIQKKEMRMGTAADKFGGVGGAGSGRSLHPLTSGFILFFSCEVVGGKAFVFRSTEALAVG